jgi:alpha/beta superfamily hydrolase
MCRTLKIRITAERFISGTTLETYNVTQPLQMLVGSSTHFYATKLQLLKGTLLTYVLTYLLRGP